MSKSVITFNYHYNSLQTEYEIYIGDEIFCHLSELDFEIFSAMVKKSGNKILIRS